MNRVPTFSLCHTTARLPDGWKSATRAWLKACDHPENVEYILGLDRHTQDHPRDGEIKQIDSIRAELRYFGLWDVAINDGRMCAVDGWNATARAANGRFLISVADDWTPCPHWDTEILKLIPNLDGEYVLDVNTGGDHEILTFSLLTRAYMNRLIRDYGYKGFFYPEYLGMMADTEFGEIARMHGVVIRAKHLLFPHDHPNYTGKPMDEVHQWQHRREALKTGEEVFLRRMELLSGLELPRFVDHPGMPPLNELFGINWEPGSLARLVKGPDKVIEKEKERRRIQAMHYAVGEACEARTQQGWLKVRVTIAREHKEPWTYRVETANHVEYELRHEDLRKVHQPQANGAQSQGAATPVQHKKETVEKAAK